jgi:ArsR family transcriptional regulator
MTPVDLFGAFASPTRLRILNLLVAEKEVCVCDLCEVLEERQPKVSRHLAILRDAELVRVRTDGRWKFYALAKPASALHRTLLRCVGSCLGEFEELAADRERLAEIDARPGLGAALAQRGR